MKKKGALSHRPQQLPKKGDAFVYHPSNSRRFTCLCGTLHLWQIGEKHHHCSTKDCHRMHIRGNEFCPIQN